MRRRLDKDRLLYLLGIGLGLVVVGLVLVWVTVLPVLGLFWLMGWLR
ncbi:MAG TPA: hypothetical protein VHL98_10135 [Microvirga sp.]|jgi:ABC-type transporter Mla subunit MlaD|nr:hypothetical protein [Microvirga sp.]